MQREHREGEQPAVLSLTMRVAAPQPDLDGEDAAARERGAEAFDELPDLGKGKGRTKRHRRLVNEEDHADGGADTAQDYMIRQDCRDGVSHSYELMTKFDWTNGAY